MTTFAYEILDPQGRRMTGTVEAPDDREAQASLQAQGWYVIRVREGGFRERRSWWRRLLSGSLPPKTTLTFWVSLSALYKAGVPLLSGLSLLADQTPDRRMQKAIRDIMRGVGEGLPLSEALARIPGAFPREVISMVEGGEAAGKLDRVLDQVTRYLEREIELRTKVVSALTYPAFVLAAMLAGILVLVTYAIPQFMDALQGTGIRVPLPTRVLYRVGMTIQLHWPWLLGALAALLAAARWQLARPRVRLALHRLLLRIPLLGAFLRTAEAIRFAAIFEVLFASGVPIGRCLEIARNVQRNLAVREGITGVRLRVDRGEALAAALEAEAVFPGMVPAMLAVGESTGRLPESCQEIARMLGRQMDALIQRFINLLGPTVTLFLAGATLFMLSSVFLPLFALTRTVPR